MHRYSLVLLTHFISIICYAQHMDQAKEILNRAISAMGGDSLLKKINSINYVEYSYRNAIEQSERPDGPFIPEPGNGKVYMNLVGRQLYKQSTSQSSVFVTNSIKLADSTSYAEKNSNGISPSTQDRLIQDENDLSPMYIYYTALKSNDLHTEADTILQKNPQKVIAFTWHHYPVRVFINGFTDFLTAYQIIKPYNDDFINIWGDSKKMVYYSFWFLEPNGLHYPYQKDIFINDWHYSSEMITQLDINKDFPADSLSIPDSIKTKDLHIETLRHERYVNNISQHAREIKKGIWIIPGFCNTTIVKQTDGIIIVEASQSNEYTKLILDKVHEIYPSEKIKAVITTSDAWLHLGGLREYASRNIPIYYLDLNYFIVSKLLAATYITKPDAWQKLKNKHPQLISVSKKISLGKGDNQLQLIPYRTETGERMMMVYFPSQKILYASDLYQPKDSNGSYWEPHYPFEVCSAVNREHLDVELLYAMHLADPISFSVVKKDMTNNFQP